MKTNPIHLQAGQGKVNRGFSLIELLVAMAVFLIIGSAAFTLASKHTALFNTQQNQAGLNLIMRNAIAQMQIDVVNAGAGFYPGADVPSAPVGVTVVNNVPAPGTPCNTPATYSYGPTCFDRLNVIAGDPDALAQPSDVTGTGIVDTTNTDLYLKPTKITPSQLAAKLHTGDELLLLQGSSSTPKMTTVKLTADAAVDSTGTMVHVVHTATGANVTDLQTGTAVFDAARNSGSNDPLGITTSDPTQIPDPLMINTFSPATDWAIKLTPISYWVDASDPTDPKLMRSQAGVDTVVAEQIIGFKVGAWAKGSTEYSFDSSTYGNDWTAIRSVRVSVVGRTAPNSDITSNFRNSFDGGPYKIQALSIVIDPRNLSNSD